MIKDRDCDEEKRKKPQRTKKTIIVDADFEEIKKHLKENIDDVKVKFALADRESVTNIHDAEEIWRSQIVFLDSALDFYIHEVTTYGFIKIFNGEWPETNNYKQKRVSMEFAVNLYRNSENAKELIKTEIDFINSQYCFMDYKNISTNLKMVGIQPANSFHKDIDKFYKRRNLIAHQSDRLPNNPVKQPISKQDVEIYITLVEAFTTDINTKVNELNNK